MRKIYRYGLAIALLALLILAACGQFPFPASDSRSPIIASPFPTSPQPTAPKPAASPMPPPKVDQEQLMQHLQALNFERYTAGNRQRAQQYLSKTLTQFGWQPTIQSFQAGGINLLAEHPGTDAKAGKILVVAHYDTVLGSPGADDNATALAAALEVARLLRSHPTPRSLQIVFFDQEEQGLQGSFAFTANPSYVNNLVGVINLEMLGYTCGEPGCQQYPEGLPVKPLGDRGDFLAVVGDQEHLPLLNAFAQQTSDQLPVMTIPIPFKGVLTPDVLRSDHAPFWVRNIGAVMVTDTANFRNPNYHQPSDTLSTLDLAFLTKATQVVVNVVNKLLEE